MHTEITIRYALSPKGIAIAIALAAALGDLWGHLSHTEDWTHIANSVLLTFFIAWIIAHGILAWR